MKIRLLAAVLAVGGLLCLGGEAKAQKQFGFGVGIGLGFNFNWQRTPSNGGGCGQTDGCLPTNQGWYGGYPAPAMYGNPYGAYPAWGGYPYYGGYNPYAAAAPEYKPEGVVVQPAPLPKGK